MHNGHTLIDIALRNFIIYLFCWIGEYGMNTPRTWNLPGITKRLAIMLLLTCLCLPSAALAEERPYVAFTNAGGKNDIFFKLMTDFMQAAATDLGLELEVYYGDRNHVVFDANVNAIFSQKRLPDVIVAMEARGSGLNLLKKAEAAGVDILFVNQGFLGEARDNAGGPGQKYAHWIFDYLPDDTHAGYILAKTLIEDAMSKKLVDENGMVNIVGISGHKESWASKLREEGLEKAVAEHPKARLLQVLNADWKEDKAHTLALRLLERYPDIAVVWAASDLMGRGITTAILETGKRPGKDVLTGGVDWVDFAIDMVEDGKFTGTVGGHFMDGGWALVMLHDRLHGITIPPSNTSSFSILTAENIDKYKIHFGKQNWGAIDFKQFSKYHNPGITTYDFSIDAVLRQVEGEKAQ